MLYSTVIGRSLLRANFFGVQKRLLQLCKTAERAGERAALMEKIRQQ